MKKFFIILPSFLLLSFDLLFAEVDTTLTYKEERKQLSLDQIKVLILDKKTPLLPDKNENLKKIGSLKGKLLVRGIHYAGDIEVYKGTTGIYMINRLPVEEYVKSVVMAEVAGGWDYEALKAQAVIVRTYAINHILKNSDSLYHLTSSTLHQMYKGNYFNDSVSKAVDDTNGEILTYDGKPIISYYHSTSGGKTELPEEVFGKSYPYLKSVKNDCTLSPLNIWERKIPFREIERALYLPSIRKIAIYSYTKTGRVKILKIKTSGSETYIEAKELRRFLGWKKVPSTLFTLKTIKDTLILSGRGYGHGVGLCQWGTLKMARDGKLYREILAYYYPNTFIHLYGDL